MSETKQIRAIKGVRDILPPPSFAWNGVEVCAREVFCTYGYSEIRLPLFEDTQLFARSVGTETDIVSKEMFTFEAATHGGLLPGDLSDMDVFVAQIRNLQSSGEIPNEPLDKKLLENLTDAFASYNKLKSGAVMLVTPQLDQLVRTIIVLRSQIRLGPTVSLRPEATASVCRAYIEHGMQTLPGNVKLYYIGPMFRRERPQKGRYRQFYQIGAEVLGQSDAPGIDAELIEMLLAFFAKTGLEGAALAVNSIGCKNCRPKYVEILREALHKVRDQLGADSQRRIETNPLRVLDSKIPVEQPIIEKLPRISDHLCEDCRTHFAELERQLALRNISYERNWRLVRGLDYYTRTTFEITAPGLGSQNAVCGGGRYDGLVELLGGPPTKGIGFAIGTDRLMMSLEAQGKLKTEPAVDVVIVWMGANAEKPALGLARRLRDAGVKVEFPATEMKLGKALGLGDKLGARYGLIIGDNEVASGRFTLKRLADAQQQSLSEQELLSELKANL